MLNISFEFRKGIFFVRFIGELNKETYKQKEKELQKIILENKFKYVVVNTNHIEKIDLDGLNYIIKIYYMTKENNTNLVICDKFKIIKTLLNNNVPNIDDELEVL